MSKNPFQPVLRDLPAPAAKKGANKKGAKKLPRIFVNIASYRDAECQWTVKDLFEQAAHPERVFVGICWQYDPEQDKHCFTVPSPRPEQVRMLPVHWRDAEGVCWARHEVQQLWEGEEYTLMIDSHMRFMRGWDDLMIEELKLCDSAKPVLSCSPPPYVPPNNLGKNVNPAVRRVKPFMADGNIRCQGEMLDRAPPHPLRGAFIVANFVFSRSEVIREVPYDPYLYFDQEEITYAARLFTHGWDVFSPRRQFLYHFYNDLKTSTRPLHWSDMSKSNAADSERIKYLYARGLKRFNHMTGYQPSSEPDVIRDLDKYGLGTVRTLAQFEAFTGIDFKRKIASEKALRGGFIEDLKKYRDRPFFVPEIDRNPPPPPMVAATPASVLDIGDFVPMIDVVDDNGQQRALEIYAGRYCLMFFLSANDAAYARRLMQALTQQVPREMHEKVWIIYLVDAAGGQLKMVKQQLGTSHALWADPGGKIAQAFGVRAPSAFLLNRNLKILQRYGELPPETLAGSIVADAHKALEEYRFKNRVPRTITELPPALIVPNAFTPELCEKCIQAFRTGHSFEGTVGAEEKLAYSPKAKIRTDHIVQPPLLEEIDEKLSRSLFPEIKKIFGFEVTHRELYKVGCYTGEKGGFFQRHRDNYEVPLGYRRIAMTLHLNNDYEGGGLHFPEYDDNIYRPAAGSAIAFSCATLHEARPVTRGERFVLVGFFHGEQDEAYRRQYLAAKGDPLRIKDYTPSLPADLPVRQGRDFYRDWYRKNVRFGGFDGGQDKK